MPFPKKYYEFGGKGYSQKYHVDTDRESKFYKSRKDRYSTPFRYKRYIQSWRFGYIDLIDQAQQKSIICPSGFTWGQGWGVLNKCWIGYKIAKNLERSVDNMKSFAKKIQSIQYDLGISKTDFSHIGLPGEVLILYDKPPKDTLAGQVGVEIEYGKSDETEDKAKTKEIPEEELNTEQVLKDIWLKDIIDSNSKTSEENKE